MSNDHKLSFLQSLDIVIIIPTLNEAVRIGNLVQYLQRYSRVPILIVDSPKTTDNTTKIARSAGAKVITAKTGGRASQMNAGAEQTTNKILYFVHADTLPPPTFIDDIGAALNAGNALGYFSYRFDSEHPLLKLNSRATRKDGFFSGGGDQTLFIKRSTFEALGGFDESLRLMEDFALVKRAIKLGHPHCLIPHDAIVSARKYELNSWLRVNLVNLVIFSLFHLGVSQRTLCYLYRHGLHR